MFNNCADDVTVCTGDECCGTATVDKEYLDCTSCGNLAVDLANAAKDPVENKAIKDRTICADRRLSRIVESIDTT